MSEVLHYSWECFQKGFQLGDYTITTFEIGCIFLWWYGQRHKRKKELISQWDELFARIGKWVFLALFVGGMLIVAPYQVCRDAQEAKAKAEKALADKAPKLIGFLDQFILGDAIAATNSVIILQVTVANAGGSPSIADHYELNVLLTNGRPIKVHPIDFVDEYNVHCMKGDTYMPLTLKRSELVAEKTSRRIEPGDAPRGWIAFILPGVLLSHYAPTNYSVVLSFVDINGDRAFVTNGYWKGIPITDTETLEFPKSLPGSGNLLGRSDASLGQTTRANAQEWLPPELPPGCSNVAIFFGGQEIVSPLDIAKISSDKSGTRLQIVDLPDYLATNVDKLLNYTPRNRSMWVRWDSIKQDYGGKTVKLPILPFVISNRLYVEVEIPFLNERRKLVMSDDFDTELESLPRTWDRNYSTDVCVYEVVNEFTNPVLQVFYSKPNEIHVHGIFIIDTNSVLESFGEAPTLKSIMSYRFVNLTNMQEVADVSKVLGTNTIGEAMTNALYNSRRPAAKAIFKYPSNRYPGVFSN